MAVDMNTTWIRNEMHLRIVEFFSDNYIAIANVDIEPISNNGIIVNFDVVVEGSYGSTWYPLQYIDADLFFIAFNSWLRQIVNKLLKPNIKFTFNFP